MRLVSDWKCLSMKLRLALISLSLLALSPLSHATTQIGTATNDAQINTIVAQTQNLKPNVLKLALKAYNKAHAQGLDKQQVLTVVDYSLPSTKKRFWVIDLKNNKVLYSELVAHGKNSGVKNATHFSNKHGSDESSLGLFKTDNSYYGHDGYALRLTGLTPGYNTNALTRDVVVHGAWYVSPQFAKTHGYIGRSWGCFALEKSQIKPVVNTIKNGSLIFAYYPDQKWIDSSPYLQA